MLSLICYPIFEMRRRRSSSRIRILRPFISNKPSEAKADSVRMAFEVVMFERFATSSRESLMFIELSYSFVP